MADDRAREINGDDDEDEALRIAIAMSLGDDVTPAHNPEPARKQQQQRASVIDLTQEEDIETASEASDVEASSMPKNRVSEGSPHVKGHHSSSKSHSGDASEPSDRNHHESKNTCSGGNEHDNVEKVVTGDAPPISSGGLAMLGLDRKRMEEERLARVRKRKFQEEADADVSGKAKSRTREIQPDRTSLTSASVFQQERDIPGRNVQVDLETPIDSGKDHHVPFPRGVVKKTWVRGQPRLGDDIRIEEVLQKDELQLAVISSFQWDQAWLAEKIDLEKTKVVLVGYAGDEAQEEAVRASVPSDRIRFCFPALNGPGSMHSKLQLLKYSNYLRLVVPTGNFLAYDWGETGTMENLAFIIDLPKIEDPEKRVANAPTDFAEDLCYFLRAQGLDERLIKSLGRYDFTETSRYGFVHTIAGSHTDESWRRTGYCGLGRTVNNLGIGTNEPIEVDCVTSSLGAITYDFLQAMYNACQGDSGLIEYEVRTASKSKKNSDPSAVRAQLQHLRDHVRIYFPSERTIDQSKGGKDGAGTIFFPARYWNQTTFPKAVLRDCKSTRARLVMHSKVLYVCAIDDRRSPWGPPTAGISPVSGFAYVGSANLSESAWGRLVRDRASGKPKMTCRNWECGVIVTVRDVATVRRLEDGQDAVTHLGIFTDTVPVPMEVPGDRYVDASASGGNLPSLGGAMLRPWCGV